MLGFDSSAISPTLCTGRLYRTVTIITILPYQLLSIFSRRVPASPGVLYTCSGISPFSPPPGYSSLLIIFVFDRLFFASARTRGISHSVVLGLFEYFSVPLYVVIFKYTPDQPNSAFLSVVPSLVCV